MLGLSRDMGVLLESYRDVGVIVESNKGYKGYNGLIQGYRGYIGVIYCRDNGKENGKYYLGFGVQAFAG